MTYLPDRYDTDTPEVTRRVVEAAGQGDAWAVRAEETTTSYRSAARPLDVEPTPAPSVGGGITFLALGFLLGVGACLVLLLAALFVRAVAELT